MKILGVSGFYHDSAASLVVGDQIIAAAQEERFSRRKHDARFPMHAIRYCLKEGGIDFSQLDWVAFYDKPILKFERILETYLAFAPRGLRSFSKSLPVWVKDKLFQKTMIVQELKDLAPEVDWAKKILFSEHHLSHAASAFYPSPFEEALVLTMDGVGEWTTTSAAIGKGSDLKIFKEIRFPHSIGLLYSAFTYYCGFKVNSGEYKLMGLAPYGEPKYVSTIRDHLIDVKSDGSYRLNLEYFDYCTGLKMTNARFDALFEMPARKSDELLTQKHMDIAASIQKVTEDLVIGLARGLKKETGQKQLCLAGGVALNCVANGHLQRTGLFDEIFVQPASGDAGGALGAALVASHLFKGVPRRKLSAIESDRMNGSYLGPADSAGEIERQLKACGARYTRIDDLSVLCETLAHDLAEERAVGWHQGRMEFGPRALGARSILGDPRSPKMQKMLNLKVKFRESFRPFAPAVLEEDVSDWFEFKGISPYMLLVAPVKPEKCRAMTSEEQGLFGIEKLNLSRSDIPAVTHVDYSARLQTVSKKTNPKFWELLSAFKKRTGCPVLVNTSFNVRGEPIVCTPTDSFRCLMGTDIERLAIGPFYLKKEDQDPALKLDYKNLFELD